MQQPKSSPDRCAAIQYSNVQYMSVREIISQMITDNVRDRAQQNESGLMTERIREFSLIMTSDTDRNALCQRPCICAQISKV